MTDKTTTTPTSTDPEQPPTADGYLERAKQLFKNASKTVLLAAFGFAFLVSLLAAWGGSGLGAGFALIAFVGMGTATWYKLIQKPDGYRAASSGCYITSFTLALVPLFIYIPPLIASSSDDSLAGAGTFFGSLMGLFIFEIVFAIIAALIAIVGYFIGKKTPEQSSD